VSYHPAPKRPDGSRADDWRVTLVQSRDGRRWQPVTRLDVPGCPNETTLRFLDDGRMVALVRRECADRHGWIGTSRPPYRRWQWKETRWRLGGPNFLVLPDGRLWAATRLYAGSIAAPQTPGTRTVLARMALDGLKPVLELPSGGDTSYPGLVWHEGLLWMSYYASHEGRSSIYLATIRLP
jgi:hypothetical protein